MWRHQKEAETKPANGPLSSTYLASSSTITGTLFFDNPATLDGRVNGEVMAKEQLIIGENGDITAPIEAPFVVVLGKVTGDIRANRIQIRAPARIVGNLISSTLV